ncbi:hypothetical protein Rxycam_02959 [Rubrobacter xylanophilus DSM 9941]|uniref:ABC transporter substrate-binding protein n=1 Tax=Rubrobacter xylanophilus TaxID=49319 RepID=UPI001C6427A2|nr:ABC transporter substrate-binding protein [Rubrobacter xylanophilus]QYJ17120.1 hypothetical protein Rxycam_02959 [Rubrobacter xylanophilus DSM 9941]
MFLEERAVSRRDFLRLGGFGITGAMLLGVMGCGEGAGGSQGGNEPYNFTVVIKATDSEFWQVMASGARRASKDLGKVRVNVQGPPSEADIEQQVSILENAISEQPDGILLASSSSDATVPLVERAMSQDIPVVLVDNRINTDNYVSFLATDNRKAGAKAAETFVEFARKDVGRTSGKLGLVSAFAGIKVLEERDGGFTARLRQIAPEIEVIGPRYVNNDIAQAASVAEDMLTANPELLGFFADNNHTGDGVARVIAQRDLGGKKAVVAFDTDDQEINALKNGAIDALIVQDPFLMGYKGILFLVDHIEGREVPKNVDTGATVVTRDNFNDPEVQGLLYPEKREITPGQARTGR